MLKIGYKLSKTKIIRVMIMLIITALFNVMSKTYDL